MDDDTVFDASPSTPSSSEPKTVLDALRVELAKAIAKPPIVLTIPSRPKIKLEFSVDITTMQLRRWQAAARIKKAKIEDYDPLRFSAIVLANQNTAIVMNDEHIIDPDGNNLTVRDTLIREYVNATDAISTVVDLYGFDGHVINAAGELIKAAGYDPDSIEEDDADDPIQDS
jgi:hypothetical protein